MPQVTSPKDLFVHELQDVYYAEKLLTKVLPQLAAEASDRELSRAFNSHLKETQKQVANLEKVFQKLGERAQAEQCPGMEGIKQEHDQFMREQRNGRSQIVDAFLTGAAARTEHYEIAAYNGLISMARALGERDSIQLLEQNLRQEKEALKKVESISKRIFKGAAKGESGGSRRTRSTARGRTGATRRSGTRATSSSRARTSATRSR
jgi:ferritin-like metal-binding protein YciE